MNQRGVRDVTTRQEFGADSQVDRKAVVLEPGRWAEYDPFMLLAEDWFSAVGFDWHPHSGMETVTLVLEGELEHRDNHGGHGVLGPGDAQWMTAGKGLFHAELAYERRPVRTLQLWVNLPAKEKMTDPHYQDLRAADMPVREEPGVRALVYSGRSGAVRGPAGNYVPVTMVVADLEPGASFVQEIPGDQNGFVYVISGEGRFGPDGAVAKAGQVVHLEPGDDAELTGLAMTADEELRLVLWAGRPLREPVEAYGPLVASTRQELAQSFAAIETGRFGPIPT
ncbi:pirin family protein [Nonomuraea sp. NPDC050556]|uniref:pirin family protein n=1 Tax=Nonomuraea sp. NPDC050556 TaxID=3364369 RepID=UPI0037BD2023